MDQYSPCHSLTPPFQAVGHISGGHMNPSVTIAMLAIGKISFVRAIMYVVVQCAGAVAGSSCMKAVLPESMYGGLGHTTLASDLQPLQGLAIEFFLGFLLLIVIIGVCDENRNDTKYTGALAIGLTVAFAHLAAIKFTGSSINGARTFGSAVVTGIWENHWVRCNSITFALLIESSRTL